MSSSLWRCTMHPTPTTALQRPAVLEPPSLDQRVDRFLLGRVDEAAGVDEHDVGLVEVARCRSAPRSASCATYRSLSTVFLSQPSVMTETFIAANGGVRTVTVTAVPGGTALPGWVI